MRLGKGKGCLGVCIGMRFVAGILTDQPCCLCVGQVGGAWDPFAPGGGQQQQQQQQQPPEDDWGLSELTDADIWGNLPSKKDAAVSQWSDSRRCIVVKCSILSLFCM